MVSPIAEIRSLSSAIYHAGGWFFQKSSRPAFEPEKPSAEAGRYSFSLAASYGLDIWLAG
jgi:hypothetical protein